MTTIQRQYILPSCSLILEGLSIDPNLNVLSILANADCKIIGIEQPLNGGLEFFKALIDAVSQYSQGLLSGLPHPPSLANQAALVRLQPGNGLYHRLIVQPEASADFTTESDSVEPPAGPIEVQLSTVQLFDLAEAIDQFLSDSQTLPDLQRQLSPLPRRFVRPSEPLAKRAVPPLLGISALVAAGIGCFFLPIPEPRPAPPAAETSTLEESAAPTAPPGTASSEGSQSSATADASATTAESTSPQTAAADQTDSDSESRALATRDAATRDLEPGDPDPTSLVPGSGSAVTELGADVTQPAIDPALQAGLQTQLKEQLQAALPSATAFPDPLVYQVSVTEEGDIVGYRFENDAALDNVEDTPLPKLTYLPLNAGNEAQPLEQVAQFRVTFTPAGMVEVSPWQEISVP